MATRSLYSLQCKKPEPLAKRCADINLPTFRSLRDETNTTESTNSRSKTLPISPSSDSVHKNASRFTDYCRSHKGSEERYDRGVILTEPIRHYEATIPSKIWRLCIVKDNTITDSIELYGKSSYSLGIDDNRADIIINADPGVNLLHATILFCNVTYDDGRMATVPYIKGHGYDCKIFINCTAIAISTYTEIIEGDRLQFGYLGERVYVLLDS